MTVLKERLTVTVDRALIEAANEAVAAGRASSVSTWVNLALAERVAKERHLHAMAEAIAAYEAEFGEISEAEMAAQRRADRRIVTAASPRKPRSQRLPAKAAARTPANPAARNARGKAA
jgi:hypothetical protein